MPAEYDIKLKRKITLLNQNGWQLIPDEPDWEKIKEVAIEDWDKVIQPLQQSFKGYIDNFAQSELATKGLWELFNPFNIPIIYGIDREDVEMPLKTIRGMFTINPGVYRINQLKADQQWQYLSDLKGRTYSFESNSKALHGGYGEGEAKETIRTKMDSWEVPSDFVRRLVDFLGQPEEVFLQPLQTSTEMFTLPTEYYSTLYHHLFESAYMVQPYHYTHVWLVWNQVIVSAFFEGDAGVICWNCKILDEAREAVKRAFQGCCLQVIDSGMAFGRLKINYNLNDFHSETYPLYQQLTTKLDEPFERLHVLVQGDPGTGKSEWIKSFAGQELAKRGYLIVHLNYGTFDMIDKLPKIFPKIAILLNEVDNFVTNRKHADETGETEKRLEQFDQNTDMVEPFYTREEAKTSTGQQVVLLMTANQTERLDPAFLREGRLHVRETLQHQYVNSTLENAKEKTKLYTVHDKLEAELSSLPDE